MTTDNAQALDPKVVSRIRKLLNLSRDGAASEAEQEIAAAHAQRLMMEHNVSVATVEAHQDASRVVRRAKGDVKGFAMYEWQQRLMTAVATVNFCAITTKQKWAGNRWVINGFEVTGREENVASATELNAYLRTTTERLAREFVGGDYTQILGRRAMSFKLGCANKLAERLISRHREALAEQRRAAEAARAGGSGNALVPIMEDFAEAEECANEDFRLNLAPGTTAHNRFVYKRKSAGYAAVRKAFAAEELKMCDDRARLAQVALEAAMGALEGAGLGEKEQKEALEAIVAGMVLNHIDEVKERKSPRKGGRRTRSWGRAEADNTDYDAYSAGTRAAKDVGLDKQVGSAAAPVKVLA